MKFVIFKNLLRNNPYLYLSVILVLWIACIQSKSLNVSNVLDRISSGDLNEKDVFDFYKKDYEASLEHHQFFQPCLAHLIQEEKGKNNSFINKLFPGMKNYFTSSYSELEFPELGIKIKCEVYINKFVSKEYKLKKKGEANPFRDSFETCKKEVSALQKIIQDLTLRLNTNNQYKGKAIQSFNFKSDENGPQIEYQDKPSSISLGDNKVEFQDKPDKNIIDRLSLKKIRSSSDSKSFSSCNEELQKIKARVTRLNKDNALLEKQIVEKNNLNQIKEELNNKKQEYNTKLKLENTQKEKALNDCQNNKIELKASLEKCKVKVGTCGGSNCAECENKLVTKIDELTTYEKIKKDLSKKNYDLSEELTTIKIRVSTFEIGKRNVEKKLTDCNSEKQSISKKLMKSEAQVNKINLKSCAELNECKKIVSEKNNEIEILKKDCHKENSPAPDMRIKKGPFVDEDERLKSELKICNQKQSKFITIIEDKNNIIIKKESEISTIEIEKNNIKTEFDKIEKVCRDEKDSFEKKITSLEENLSEENKKHQICKNEIKEIKNYKKKSEKCEDNSKKERTKFKEVTEKQKIEIIRLKSDLDKCERESKRHERELHIKISMYETCERDKEDLINRLKGWSQKVDEEKRKFVEFSNTVTIEKDRAVNEEQRKCKIQINIFTTKLVNYEKEIRLLRLNQDCPIKLTKCTNEKVIIENTLKSKETEIIRIKEEKDTCENELRLIREKFIKIKTNETVCKKTLEETTVNWRNCESKKPVPCPIIDQSIIIKIRREHEKCKNELINYKDDNQKYKATIERLEKLIREYEERKNKCVGNCTADLETCQKNIIQIQNKCDEEIRQKIDEINTYKITIHKNEEKCLKKIRVLEENNKKCTRNLILIKAKADDCQKIYVRQVDINKQYVIEITNLKTQLNICLKKTQCLKNIKGSSGPVYEKCEKQRTALLKETFTLNERITKLQEEKKSIYMSSKQIIATMENKCEKDLDSYGTIMEDIETRIKHLYSIKIAIDGEIRSDEILILSKQKEINVKTEEKNIFTSEIARIRNDYERIIFEINNIREKIRKSNEIEKIRTLTDNIFNKERELKGKNEMILKTSQKEKEILNVIVIIQEQINNYTIIKNIRLQKIKDNKENIENLNKFLIKIKSSIETKKTNIDKIGVKIEKFTNVRVMVDSRISSLEKEKDKIAEELVTCNTKLEEEKSTNNLLHMKINKTVTTGLIDVNLLMRIFGDNSFTERNCARLNRFKTKFYKVCPMKSHVEAKVHKKKRKNTPVESQFPLKAIDLGNESQEKIKSISVEDNKGKNDKIESQFPLQNKDLKIESQFPLNDGILNKDASLSSSSSSYSNSSDISNLESQFPLKNKDFKIDSQGQLDQSILKENSSSGHSKYTPKGNMKIESQMPLDASYKIKVESQEPLNGAKKFRNESEGTSKNQKTGAKTEEKLKGETEFDLNKTLIKLFDAVKS